jgi:diaminohydroxyphosphoribosylaminopyrimidine deaminase/5-amino-6-(5-phosphoribosylamino)uracil reductase
MADAIYKHQIQSVIIEGGRQTLQTFIDIIYGMKHDF